MASAKLAVMVPTWLSTGAGPNGDELNSGPLTVETDKEHYQQAKAFLKDAVKILGSEGSVSRHSTYRKPDGSAWQETESKLEAPEWYYTLHCIHPASRTE